METPRGSIWDKVDLTVLAEGEETQEAATSADGPDLRAAKARRRRMFIALDILGTLVWTYVLLQLFVVDVDRVTLEAIAPGADEVLNYKIFFVLALFVLFVLFARRYWLQVLYVLFFPLVVIFWIVPKLIYKTKSWLVLFAAINVVAAIYQDFKFNVVTKTLAVFCVLAILLSSWTPLLVMAALGLLALLLVSYVRIVRSSFQASRFVSLQETAIRGMAHSQPISDQVKIADELRGGDVEKFNKEQLQKFAGSLSNGLLLVRAVQFWAYQLDRYRQSPAVSFFSFLSYAWLFTISVVTLWMVNLALMEIDASAFDYVQYPSNALVLYYSFFSIIPNGIAAMEPASTLAIAIKIGAGAYGVLLLAVFAANLLFSSRRQRQESALTDAVAALRRQAEELEDSLDKEYEATSDQVYQWLLEFGHGTTRWVAFLSARMSGPGTGGSAPPPVSP